MKRYLFKQSVLLAAFALGATAYGSHHEITVVNPSEYNRVDEIVELERVHELHDNVFGKDFKIIDNNGKEISYQITYDDKLIFPVTIDGSSKGKFKIVKGKPSSCDSIVYGRLVPERKDDMAWENDKSAYRAYGPALQESGERAFGYDIWTKCVPYRILDQRYHDDIVNKISFHVDHGTGMDVYAVGPTLGGGTAALLDKNGEIVYPYCFKEYEVLDNGPLRFTVKLIYGGETVDGDSAVVETRLISLDKSSYLNKTTVSYDGLSKDSKVAPGIVVHKQNPAGYIFSPEDHFMAYSDLTENADNGNGIIFVGVVSPESDTFEYKPLKQPAGDAVGHILAPATYSNSEDFTYWWGSAWSKGDVRNEKEWSDYLRSFNKRLKTPLKVKLK